jgi:hypothetical protein
VEVVQELAVALELPLRSLRSLQRPEVEDGVLVEVGDCYLPRRERFEYWRSLFVSVLRRQMGDSDDYLQGQFVLGEQINELAFDLCMLEVLAFGLFPHQSPQSRPLCADMH